MIAAIGGIRCVHGNWIPEGTANTYHASSYSDGACNCSPVVTVVTEVDAREPPSKKQISAECHAEMTAKLARFERAPRVRVYRVRRLAMHLIGRKRG